MIASSFGLAATNRVQAGFTYSVQELGSAFGSSSPYEVNNYFGRDMLRIDDSGTVLLQPTHDPYGSSPYSGPTPIGTGAVVFATGLSDNGLYAAGTVYQQPSGQSNWAAFVASGGQAVALGDLAGQDFSAAYAVNNSGQVVGSSGQFSFLYTPGQGMTGLGTLGGSTASAALDINNAGLIVGLATLAGGANHAFVDDGSGMVDLNTLISPDSGLTLTSATGVNDLDQIVGYGVDGSGFYHEVLLTPGPRPCRNLDHSHSSWWGLQPSPDTEASSDGAALAYDRLASIAQTR